VKQLAPTIQKASRKIAYQLPLGRFWKVSDSGVYALPGEGLHCDSGSITITTIYAVLYGALLSVSIESPYVQPGHRMCKSRR
jgi:hypothetical protein